MSLRRVIAVVLGASACGAVIGAACAVIAVAVVLAFRPPHDSVFKLDALPSLMAIARLGGAVGAVTTPLIGFGFLRRVPLGPAAVVMALATIVGAVIGEFIAPLNPYDPDASPGILQGAVLAFVIAGFALRLTARRPRPPGSIDPAG